MENKSLERFCSLLKNGRIFSENSKIKFEEIGDGNLNYVFRASTDEDGDKKSVIIKLALPYLKIAGEAWPLTVERNKIEYESLKFLSKFCGEYVPKVYLQSKEEHLFIMEDLSHMEILRKGLMNMQIYQKLAGQIGDYLAKTLYYTSDFGFDSSKKKKLAVSFDNPELCDITERLVFTDPYQDSLSNNIRPGTYPIALKLWDYDKVKVEIDALRYVFMNTPEALIHGDLHTGSIFVSKDNCKIFDSEFTFYGPISYDIGLFFANILFDLFYWEYNGRVCSIAFKQYLLSVIEDTWNSFKIKFTKLCNLNDKSYLLCKQMFVEKYLKHNLKQSIGFCACEMLRRVIGMAHVPELDAIIDNTARDIVERYCIEVAEKMLLLRNNFDEIEDFTNFVKLNI
ncbi:S-methyl-5-thioribose kinase [Clostridium boliviensis]|uniref:S-methyl-5-thioribose kinase n=1 Tax=Clostridium boliviensis TaxID=318465 RepID=A0ABU4GQL1_9CLOT|nr:S-methyl-5-thioribose kinase [Clostridium boliviensis]MDW2799923.1 S-methyl-5-thioribose kinase [Clostridium boliviensis]